MSDTAALRRLVEAWVYPDDFDPQLILDLLSRLDRYEAALREITNVYWRDSTHRVERIARDALNPPERDG